MKNMRSHKHGKRSVYLFLMLCLIVSNTGRISALSEIHASVHSNHIINPPRDSALQLNPFLDELAKDTWNYLHSNEATDQHLPWSWHAANNPYGNYNNVAEIGFYALSWLVAYDFQRPWSPTWTATETEVTAVLDQLRAW